MASQEHKASQNAIPHVDTTALGQGVSGTPGSMAPKKRGHKARGEKNAQTLITRRGLLFGALGAGAVAAGVAGSQLLGSSNADEEEIATLAVPEDAVFDLESCAEVDPTDAFELLGSYDLPFGTLVWADDSNIAACLFPTEDPSPLTNMGVLQLGTGAYYTLQEAAVGAEEGFEIYDVRANEQGMVWMEAAVMEGLWRIYTATLSADLSLGTPELAEEGNASVEVPTITVCNNYAFWQTMAPITNENARREPSALKRVRFGSKEAEVVYESTGRMSAPPTTFENSIVFTPRHAEAVSYCDLVRLDASSGRVLDTLTLPSGMFPHQVAYGPTGFAFCFESIYNYGEGIANLGTYTPASTPQNNNYTNLDWFRFNRTPTAAPCWCTNNWFMVKSNQSVCAVNFQNKVFCSLGVESGCLDWGDFLVSNGMRNTVVTAMQIDQVDNEGEETKKTLVRVWQPLSATPAQPENAEEQNSNQEEN